MHRLFCYEKCLIVLSLHHIQLLILCINNLIHSIKFRLTVYTVFLPLLYLGLFNVCLSFSVSMYFPHSLSPESLKAPIILHVFWRAYRSLVGLRVCSTVNGRITAWSAVINFLKFSCKRLQETTINAILISQIQFKLENCGELCTHVVDSLV